ncbi:MAG: DMT family transporter [bacterium]|nr:DMT family transporter [Candidatus Aquidulcis frankliniae]
MIGALFGVIAAFSWGGGDFLGGLASRRLPTFLVVATSQAAALALLIPVAVLFGGTPPSGPSLLTTALAGIVGGTGVLSLYHGFAHGRISIVASIAGTLAALIPVGVSIAQGEVPSALRLFGFFAAIVSIIIVSTSAVEHAVVGEAGAHADASSGSAARGGAVYGVAAGMCFAGFSLIFSGVESDATVWLLTILRIASVSALTIVFITARLVGRRPPGDEPIRAGAIPSGLLPRLRLLLLLAAAGTGDTLGNLFFFLSSGESGVAVAAVFTSIAPITTVIFAALLLGERVAARQGLGIALAGVATVAIALGGVA